MRWRLAVLVASLVLVCGVYVLLPIPVVASVALPDAATIIAAYAFQNVLQAGDQFYLIPFDIEYGTPPDDYTARDLFFIRLLSSDGTEYAANVPYAYYNAGYDYGISGFYFSADDVASRGIPYGEGSGIRVQLNYNPTISWASTPSPYTLSTITWNDSTSPQIAATIRVRILAQKLEDEWGGVVDIISGASWARALTVYGEDYFTNAVPNIINVCPTIFSSYKDIPDWPEDLYVSDLFIRGDADVVYPVYGTHWIKQGWVATGNYTLDWIQLKLSRTGTPPSSLMVTIYESGTAVASGNLAPSSVTAEPRWVSIVTSPQSITRGRSYELVCYTAGGSPSAAYNIYAADTGEYPYGTLSTSENSGGIWTSTDDDMVFVIESSEAYSQSFSKGWAHRLDGTPFDLSGMAHSMGISPMWLRGLLWMLFTLGICIAVTRATLSIRPVLFTVLLMTAIGAAFGFYYITFAAFVMFLTVVVVIYSLMWEKSSA